MKSYIQITRHLYEEPYHLNLVIIASNGLMSGALEFYTNPDILDENGRGLEEFPNCHHRLGHIWEHGSETSWRRFSPYFLLRAYSLRKSEQCSFHLRLNNNIGAHNSPKLPAPAISEFCIRTTQERIQKFGGLLRTFAKLEHQRLFWANDEAFVDNELINKDSHTSDPVRSAVASLPLRGYIHQDVDPHVRF